MLPPLSNGYSLLPEIRSNGIPLIFTLSGAVPLIDFNNRLRALSISSVEENFL